MDVTPCKSFQKDDLEITRNPFDSREFDKENLPAFSPSIFVVSGCKSSEKKNKSFRWSIDQIAALVPADIDEFPNQEYSGSYEREEDEAAVQSAINEYFSKVILPSPWMRNTKENAFKRVTFSPHPPTYFKEASFESNSSSSSNSSQSKVEKKFVDCSSQTTLTIPPNVDLEKLLGEQFFAYAEPEKPSNSKELNISTLRRKLFSYGEKSPSRGKLETGENNPTNRARSVSSTPRTPRTPNLVTSSPFREEGVVSDNDSVFQSSFIGDAPTSPVVSPIKIADDDDDIDIAKSFTRLSSPDTSFDLSISSITDSLLWPEKLVSSDLEVSPRERETKKVAFYMKGHATQTGSAEPSDSIVDIKESTRVAPMEIPGFSPIKHEETMDISVASTSKCDYDMLYNGQSVKESTAYHIHGITGLFSPIKDGRNSAQSRNIDAVEEADPSYHVEGDIEENDNDSVFDGGPLEITDLSLTPEKKNFQENSADISSESDEIFQNPVVIVSPYPTPKRGILKHTATARGTEERAAMANDRFQNRLENIEEKINRVENEIESVKSNYEHDIREIKKNLTPAKKFASVSSGVITADQSWKNCDISDFSDGCKNTNDYTNTSDFKRNGVRKPLQDRTNSNKIDKHKNRWFQMEHDTNGEIVVRNGYTALNRARKVQRKIDEDFAFCLETKSQDKHTLSNDNSDVESAEVADILTLRTNERITREGHRINYIERESDIPAFSPFRNKFKDYRFQAVRESLNDSWDLRTKGTMDVAEIDASVLSYNHIESSTPTPIMNLECLSIYNPQKENRIPNPIQKPIPIDRRRLNETGKIERRHTWPNMKSTRTYTNRSISPTVILKSRMSRGYSFAKHDIVNKLREEWKNRPSPRTGFTSFSR